MFMNLLAIHTIARMYESIRRNLVIKMSLKMQSWAPSFTVIVTPLAEVFVRQRMQMRYEGFYSASGIRNQCASGLTQ
jgi:hypothetical protein